MERNEIKIWLPVAAVWFVCAAVTALALWKNRTSETAAPTPRSVTENSSPETLKASPENIMIIGTAESSSPVETAEAVNASEEPRGFEPVRESTAASTTENGKIHLQPETHVVPLPEKSIAQPEENEAAEPGTGTVQTGNRREAAETAETAETAGTAETAESAVVRTESPAGFSGEEKSTAVYPGPDSDSDSMIPYDYKCSEANGVTRQESYDDRFFVSFHRTASGETLSFDYITYDTRWISALGKRYPEEDPEHAASVKARFLTRGSVYSYRISDFRDGISWINILPDDLIVIVEEGGKEGIRVYAAEGYNRAVLPDL